MKHFFSLVLLTFLSIVLVEAAAPANYYNSAEGKSSNTLRLALQDIIDGHTVSSYDELYDIYPTSDLKGTNNVWDMYSTCTWVHGNKKCGNYSSVCDCYNREHSVPQSWFGSSSPMKSDAFHVYPTDGKVNGQRSNYPFGECSGGTSLGGKALGRLGSSTFSGYSGTVFEPDDEYKGDFARTYFYMATRYAGEDFNETSNGAVAFTSDADLTNYSIQLFLKWHREDPVSSKEITRNDAVYAFQHNRNPFIDYPELAEYIWGNKKGSNWYMNSTGVEDAQAALVTLYPNPASSETTVNGLTGSYKYMVLSIAGSIVLQGETEGNLTLSISDLENGLYLLHIVQDGKQYMQKFVVSH